MKKYYRMIKAFIGDDLRYAAIILKRKSEPTISLSDYLKSRTRA